jgi:glycosyltransferase involved in cell wall biosynthesis
MRIAIDVTPLQMGHAYRGIGVYTRNLVRGLVVDYPDHEWVLLCLGAPARELPAELPNGPHIRIVHIPGIPRSAVSLMVAPPGVGHLRGALRFLSLLITYQVLLPLALMRARPTLFHSLAVDTQPTVPIFVPCRMIVTLHDVVPRLYPRHYLAKHRDALIYNLMLSRVRRASHIITDSETSRTDITVVLGCPESAVSAVTLGVETSDSSNRRAIQASSRILPESYFIYAGSLDHVKNFDNLLFAFAKASARNRGLFLVTIGHSREDLVRYLQRDLTAYPFLVPLGFVPREEVASLFAGALGAMACYRYQGFGLPLAEAMAAGCPVITSNSGAMREVAGGAALLVDPENVAEIADALLCLNADADLRAHLRAQGLKRASQLNWACTVSSTWKIYESVAHSAS